MICFKTVLKNIGVIICVLCIVMFIMGAVGSASLFSAGLFGWDQTPWFPLRVIGFAALYGATAVGTFIGILECRDRRPAPASE